MRLNKLVNELYELYDLKSICFSIFKNKSKENDYTFLLLNSSPNNADFIKICDIGGVYDCKYSKAVIKQTILNAI